MMDNPTGALSSVDQLWRRVQRWWQRRVEIVSIFMEEAFLYDDLLRNRFLTVGSP